MDGFALDPVHKEGNRWYFWDETWADRLGPYRSREEAHRALTRYCEYLNCSGSDPRSCLDDDWDRWAALTLGEKLGLLALIGANLGLWFLAIYGAIRIAERFGWLT